MDKKLVTTIDGLTGLRGLAAWWVVLFHIWMVIVPSILGKDFYGVFLEYFRQNIHINIQPVFYGWIGVQIFFVLSGFLLFLPFAQVLLGQREKINLKDYFKRRCKRILPAYYGQIAILAGLSFFGLYNSVSLASWGAHILLLHNFSSVYNWEINGVSWTIPVEFDFYLVLPLLFFLIYKIKIYRFILVAVGCAIVYKTIIFSYVLDKEVIYKVWLLGQLPGRIDLFGFGMLGAFVYQKYNNKIQQLKYKSYLEFCLIVSGISGVLLFINFLMRVEKKLWNGHSSLFFIDSLLGGAILLLVMGITIDGKLSRILFANRFIEYLGTISYSTYLWHMPIFLFIFQNKKIVAYIDAGSHPVNFLVALMLACAAVLAASALSYRYVELPFLRKNSVK